MKIETYLLKTKEKMLEWIEELGDNYILETFKSIKSGKMVRSQLMYYIAEEKAEEVLNLSAIIEMVHLASLLHDDVIDDSDTRRGVPSVNATEGSKVSVMLGDVLYSKAFVELGNYPKDVIKYVAGAVTKLSIGEIADVNLAKDFNSNENLYMDMIYNKTASLIETASRVSAIISNKNSEDFAKYGKNLGLAFQIIDDILDIIKTSEELGKPAMNDFIEGKTTLPYIYLFNKLEKSEKEKLISMHKKELSDLEANWIFEKFEEFGAIEQAYDLAENLSNQALEIISKYENEKLESIIKKLMLREN
jgi:octaprenyl-diphosphate synthase